MAGAATPLERVYELLRELRLGIRRVEVADSATRGKNDDAWTRSAIEVKR